MEPIVPADERVALANAHWLAHARGEWSPAKFVTSNGEGSKINHNCKE